MMWQRSIRRFAKPYKRVSHDELLDIFDKLARFGDKLVHTPYANLQRMDKHKVGTLTPWPKLKTLDASSWDKIKWRPLSSYAGHRWKRMFNLTAMWSTFALTHTKSGLHYANPDWVLRRIIDFNRDVADARHTTDPSLDSFTLDIGEFFTNV